MGDEISGQIEEARLELDYLCKKTEILRKRSDANHVDRVKVNITKLYSDLDNLMTLCVAWKDDRVLPGGIVTKAEYRERINGLIGIYEIWVENPVPVGTPESASSIASTSNLRPLLDKTPGRGVPSIKSAKTSSTSRSSRAREKVQLAKLALHHERVRRREEEAKAQLDAEKAQLEAEMREREAERKLELAEAEWEAQSVRSGSTIDHLSISGSSKHSISQKPRNSIDPYRRDVTADIRPSARRNEETIRPPRREESPISKTGRWLNTKTEDPVPPKLLEERKAPNIAQSRRPMFDREERYLPKPTIEKFLGDPLDYNAFVNRYNTHIASRVQTADLKLSYLLQYCGKTVFDEVKHLADDNPEDALVAVWQEIKDRYGQPHIIAAECEKRLRQTLKINETNIEAQERFAVLTRSCVTALKEHLGNTTLDSAPFIASVVIKLPEPWRDRWVRTAAKIQKMDSRVANFSDFSRFVKEQSNFANSIHSKELLRLLGVKTNSFASKSVYRKPTAPVCVTAEASQPKNTERSNPNSNKLICLNCKGGHKLVECSDLKAKGFADRLRIVQNARACYRCLGKAHKVAECRTKLHCASQDCGSTRHHTLLHQALQDTPEIGKSGPSLAMMGAENVTEQSRTYLDVVPVRVTNGEFTIQTYAFLDPGSVFSFCDRKLIEALHLQGNGLPFRANITTMIASTSQPWSTFAFELLLEPLAGGDPVKLRNVAMTDRIPVTKDYAVPVVDVECYAHLQGVNLPHIDGGAVTLLIGNDNFHAYFPQEIRVAPDPSKEPHALKTPLGWMLKGPSWNPNEGPAKPAMMISAADAQTADTLMSSFPVNDLGEIVSPPDQVPHEVEGLMIWVRNHKEASEFGLSYSREDVVAYDMMTRLIKIVDGHFQLPLLWKNDAIQLPHSLRMAQKRFDSLAKRMARDLPFAESYNLHMQTYIDKGYAELIPPEKIETTNKVWYLPHHAVVNPKKPGKVRVVFDCAAKAYGLSLNDTLMKGPDLVNSLVGVLSRFRKGPVAILSDIEAMFHQVKVAPQDRDALRFLWKGDRGELEHYRMTVHLFGARSSPSCAAFCLREAAREYGKLFDTNISKIIRTQFYVDDCLTTAANDDAGIKIVEDLRKLLAMAGFKLTKWLSNSRKVMESIPDEERSKAAQDVVLGDSVQERVLGMRWCVSEDAFRFEIDIPEHTLTRRRMLSIANSLFDPLGLVAPVVLQARLLYRRLCQLQLGWDEPADGAEVAKWTKWCDSLKELEMLRIPRCICPKPPREIVGVQLHVFADASVQARGVACYMRTVDENSTVTCNLIRGKALLSDGGSQTIPRLELEAALDAVKLARAVKAELELQDCPCFYWTDSMIVLQSLRADCKKFPVYSRNRLSQIESHTKIDDWKHVPTDMNPADEASRGSTAAALLGSTKWLNGPTFLKLPQERWPNRPEAPATEEDALHASFTPPRIVGFVGATSHDVTSALITSFSSLNRLKIATSWLLRFKTYLLMRVRGSDSVIINSPISVAEMKNAELALIRYVQQQSFPECIGRLRDSKPLPKHSALYKLDPVLEQGILRAGGRLQNADLPYDARHPIILPQKHHLTMLIIRHVHSHNAGHMGVRATLNLIYQKFWIINAKVATRQIIHACVSCLKRNAKPCPQLMAALPDARFQIHKPPFSHVGCDYFGPFMVKQKRSMLKRYGCIFTCLTTRAVHLEVAPDMTTSAFINALRRFIARRGPVTEIYSDNGTNFVGAERGLRESIASWNQAQLHDFLRQKQINWHFNPPAASHMGGVWERLIRTVKRILAALLPEHQLLDDDILTLFAEVEDMINSRPLTEVSAEVGDDLPLTPNHLLRLNPSIALPPRISNGADSYARQRYRLVQYLADQFWKKWIKEYPRTVLQRKKWHRMNRNFILNDIVLVVDNSTPRGHWPMGRVIETFADKHGVVRRIKVSTTSYEYTRAPTELVLLIPADSEESPDT